MASARRGDAGLARRAAALDPSPSRAALHRASDRGARRGAPARRRAPGAELGSPGPVSSPRSTPVVPGRTSCSVRTWTRCRSRTSKDVPYRSTVPGVSHACGHDVHTTVMVGVAERLAAAPLPAGRVSVVFQPAEERPFGEPSGAVRMLEEGLLADGDPTAVIGLHCWPDLPAGTIGIDDVIAMGGKDAFRIALEGRPSHAATPSRGRDAILGIAQLVTGLHQGFARSLDPGDLAILNVGTIHGRRFTERRGRARRGHGHDPDRRPGRARAAAVARRARRVGDRVGRRPDRHGHLVGHHAADRERASPRRGGARGRDRDRSAPTPPDGSGHPR